MSPLVNQPSAKPTRKVTGGAVIGIPVGVILVWILERLGVGPIPGEVAAATGSILSFLAAYFLKERA